MLTDKFSKAVSVANYAHYDQTRKGTKIPYISHPLAVASLAIEFGATEDQAVAELLHDTRAIVVDLREVGPAVFDRFKAGMKGTLWYCRNLADIFSRRGALMAKQLEAAVSKMEGLATHGY